MMVIPGSEDCGGFLFMFSFINFSVFLFNEQVNCNVKKQILFLKK